MTHIRFSLAFAAALVSCTAGAVQPTLTSGGFSGMGLTPDARLLGWGEFGFAYDREVPGARDTSGHNFVAGFGLLPNLEVSARIAANSLNANGFTDPNAGIRDLSASAKLGIGLDPRNRWRIAGGIADFGGAATNFRTYYGVVSYVRETIEFSGGLAHRPARNGNGARSPLDGPFASAAWQPFEWIRGHVEYTDGNAWAGVRLFAPHAWLPEGWSAYVGANARLTDTTATSRSWLSAGLTIPLYKVPALPSDAPRAPLPALAGTQQPLPAYEARKLPVPAAVPPVAVAPAAPAVLAPDAAATAALPSDAALEQLGQALRAKGLEDIWVGRMPDASIAVRANNATYNWNAVDALGAGLGAIARILGQGRTPYRFVLTQRQVPLVAVTGQTDCLRQWIEQPQAPCAAGELSTPGSGALDGMEQGAAWVVRGLQPSWKTLRVALSPVLRTNVATEVGVLDYSAGVNVGFSLPLWKGASADWRVQTELAHSDDYAPGGLLYPRRMRGGTERLALTQTLQLPVAGWFGRANPGLGARPPAPLAAQDTVGRLAGHFDGVHGALRWEPGEGRHRVLAQAGWLHNTQYGSVPAEPRQAVPLLLSYRYNLAATRTYFEATGGQFFNNDRGLQVGMRQWFGDVALQLYLRRSKFSSSAAHTMAGLALSVPIGPRRDMNPSWVQVTGTPRFAHAVETVVREQKNAVTTGYGVLPPAPSLDAVFNSDRASLLYFEDNIRRIRDAAR